MGKKQHATLCETFESKFPGLFNFEMCSLLMIDAADGCLFKFHTNHDDRKKRQEQSEQIESVLEATKRKPIIVRLPKDRGITGIAISMTEVQVIHNGDYNINYAAEVDNSVGLAVIKNMMIGPCIDTQGKLRGCIQLFNKTGLEPISIQEQMEFEKLLPTVAEMIKQADEVKYVGDLAANVNL